MKTRNFAWNGFTNSDYRSLFGKLDENKLTAGSGTAGYTVFLLPVAIF